jgi:ATP-dependent RNA helicase DeaD
MTETPFENLNLSPALLRAVKDLGYENATDIQAQTIPLILEGRDVIGRSHTGTGKTAAFGIPAIELVDGNIKNEVQVLLLCPTRELAMQAWGEFKKMYKYKTGVKAAAIYGGQNIEKQIKELKKGVNIVIGTPGRIMDHMRRRTLKLANLKMVILDEADEMLNMGFREDIETILSETPPERRTILFSATMPPEILAITKIYQKNPQLIAITNNQVTLTAIEQFYCEAPVGKKPEALIQLLMLNKPQMSIVFCNTQRMVDDLCQYLNDSGYPSVGIHGNMKQSVRTQVMESFKNGSAKMLVATDIAARGIDAQDVEAVINFDIPQNTEYYVHRIGRTGRAGKEGKAYTIISGKKQTMDLREIERFTKVKMIFQDVQVAGHVLHLNNKPNFGEAPVSRSAEPRRFEQQSTRPEANKSRSFNSKPKNDVVKIVLNLGNEQHIGPNHIVGAITERTSLSGSDIGKIEILSKTSTVEVPTANMQEVIDIMNGSKIKGLFVGATLQAAQPKPAYANKYQNNSDRKDNRRGKFD